MTEQMLKRKWCPFANRPCLKEGCELWTLTYHHDIQHGEGLCAIRRIASMEYKGALATMGVP